MAVSLATCQSHGGSTRAGGGSGEGSLLRTIQALGQGLQASSFKPEEVAGHRGSGLRMKRWGRGGGWVGSCPVRVKSTPRAMGISVNPVVGSRIRTGGGGAGVLRSHACLRPPRCHCF